MKGCKNKGDKWQSTAAAEIITFQKYKNKPFFPLSISNLNCSALDPCKKGLDFQDGIHRDDNMVFHSECQALVTRYLFGC